MDDNERRRSPRSLLKWVVTTITEFGPSARKIWEKRRSCRALNCYTISAHWCNVQKQVEEVEIVWENDELYTVGPEEVKNERVMTVEMYDKFQRLPDDLIERILAMMPFPQICNARVLSKSWRDRFWSVKFTGSREKRLLAISFQNQVRERSINWVPPCPIYAVRSDKKHFYAYDCVSDTWRSMPSLSFLPEAIFYNLVPKQRILELRRSITNDPLTILNKEASTDTAHIKCLQLVDSALLLVATVSEKDSARDPDGHFFRDSPLYLLVADQLTQTWRRLPQAPQARDYYVAFVKLVTQPALGKYKVIVFCFGTGVCFAQCYDSKSNSWRRTESEVRLSEGLGSPTHLDGFLYMKVGCGWKSLLAFNVEEEIFEVIQLVGMSNGQGKNINLVACNRNLLMIAQSTGGLSTVVALKLDLQSRTAFVVTRGPPTAHLRRHFSRMSTECVSEGVTSIYFRLMSPSMGATGKYEIDAMVACNMCTRAWHYAPLARGRWLDSSFQTNCDPFLEV